MDPRNRIYVAMDINDEAKLRETVESLRPYVGGFKFGLESLAAFGIPKIVYGLGIPPELIFHDGKYNDIGTTVGKAVNVLSNLGIGIINVQASTGIEAMSEAVKNKRNSKIIAVTLLTSFNTNQSKHTFCGSPEEVVMRFAYDAKDAGCDGIICSPKEILLLRDREEFDNMLIITPGVRPTWAAANDQKRFATPRDAILDGADYLVVGRPITNPPNGMTPAEAAIKINEEIQEALLMRSQM
jgi:orotidine-5'-phosphate decarboxylase